MVTLLINQNPVDHRQIEEITKSEMGDKQEWVSIFLNSYTENGKKSLSADLVKQIVDSAMKAFRERLRSKERLILSRLDKELKVTKMLP